MVTSDCIKKGYIAKDTPWEASWNSNELAILNKNNGLSIKELSLIIPSKSEKEIYWKLNAQKIANKTYNWLINKNVEVFRPSKLCANSVAGIRYISEANEVLSMLIKDGKVIQNQKTHEYIMKQYEHVYIKKDTSFIKRLFDIFSRLMYNN